MLRSSVINKLPILFIAFSLFQNSYFGQKTGQARIDSLQIELDKAKEDASKVNLLNTLGSELATINFFKAISYLADAERLAKKINFERGLADALNYQSNANELQGDYFESLKLQMEALKIREKINDQSGISNSIHYIGDIYFSQSELMEKASAKLEYNNKALEFYLKSLKIAEQIGDKNSIANTFNCLGNSYREFKKYDLALNFYFKAVKLREEEGNKRKLSQTLGQIGKLYLARKEYDKALDFLFKSLKLGEETDYKRTNVKTLGTLGNVFLQKKEYSKAIEYCNRSLALSKELGFLEFIAKANYSLSRIYEAPDFNGRNGDKALTHYKAYIVDRDSINTKNANQAELQFDFDKKVESAKAEQNKKDALAKAESKKQKLILLFVALGLLFVLVFAGFIFRSLYIRNKQNKIISEQKRLVEEKQKEIIESITYAKRLQEAILPPKEFLEKNIPRSFILYKPKDLVAGDFYWAEKIGDRFYIAAADSTGHGVPGAMVSVVCSNALNRTIKEFKETETGRILDKTRELVIETFEKSVSEVKDGMDISLLCIDSKNKKINWSGANNPLWYFEKGELKEIKADKQPIGKTEYPKPFTTHSFEYKEETTFYLFTDGYADQFGGPNGKKFKYKQFSDLLTTSIHENLQQQSELINEIFEEWKGDLEQVDDVCIIGVRV